MLPAELSCQQRCCECGVCAGGAGEQKRRIISAGGLVPRKSAAGLGAGWGELRVLCREEVLCGGAPSGGERAWDGYRLL